MAPHSRTLAWKIPWTEEPGRLQSMGPQSGTRLSDFTYLLKAETARTTCPQAAPVNPLVLSRPEMPVHARQSQ